jgi:hypothetical protein
MEVLMPPALRTLTHCPVCRSAEVHTDEVTDREVVLLAECPRCEHRWTLQLAPAATALPEAAPAPPARAA